MDDQGSPFSGQAPDFSDVIKLFRRYRRYLFIGVLLLAALALALLSYYQVAPDQVGVVTRFGKFYGLSEPGLHFKIPLVDRVRYVEAKRQHKMEFGFRTVTAGVRSDFRRDATTFRESIMLTGDLNVAVVEWIVQYQITDPYRYVFKVRNVEGTLHAMSEAVMRSVVGDYSVTEVLTKGREEILARARTELADLAKRYELGITINRIELKDSAPPDPVKPSFNEVNQAEQERDRLQNEAWSGYNKAIFAARGEALQRVQEAEGYATERVNHAHGDVALFKAIQTEYQAAPEVTRTRLYLETLAEVLPRAGRKVFIDENTRSLLPMLMPMEPATGSKGGAR